MPVYCTEIIEVVKILLALFGVPVLVIAKDDFEIQLKKISKKLEINLCFVLSFSYKILSSLYNVLVIGFFNVHP